MKKVLCSNCQKRKPLSCVNGKVWKQRPHHDLCPKCWKALMDSHRMG